MRPCGGRAPQRELEGACASKWDNVEGGSARGVGALPAAPLAGPTGLRCPFPRVSAGRFAPSSFAQNFAGGLKGYNPRESKKRSILYEIEKRKRSFWEALNFEEPVCLGLGSWLSALGSWISALGAWLLALGSWVLGLGSWLLDLGPWGLDVCWWTLALASWLLGSWVSRPGLGS